MSAFDVTSQVVARQESERNTVAAEQHVRFSEMFAGMLGHDLRNPLSAIVTASDREKSERIV